MMHEDETNEQLSVDGWELPIIVGRPADVDKANAVRNVWVHQWEELKESLREEGAGKRGAEEEFEESTAHAAAVVGEIFAGTSSAAEWIRREGERLGAIWHRAFIDHLAGR